ncbi:SUR7/PalI family-domain-containing protein [Lasiosphaeris hirsuta]|uniref:SUR7/PalI family-domain-containing protein n=1 Tax=Lasiosphaeris hirsuta TaxID=260670 RepID=A0AA40EAI5_9PEZI|nr:SUR7/PalI family-domain-containing protein [Lasiosphaeris hirsuta]
MVSFGRFACVALPFALTLASLIALLVAGLAGIADKSLYLFQVNTTDLSISPLSVNSILNSITSRSPTPDPQFHDPTGLLNTETDAKSSNISAADLGLYNLYDVGIWGYCYTPQNGSRACTKPAFNWAESTLNETTTNLEALLKLAGQNGTLPSGVTDAVKAFTTVARWTQIVYIIAYIALGVALFFGIFANCSRAFSCVTFIIAALATIAVCGAAALSTAMAVVIVGAVEGTAKFYGVQGSFNTKFLAAVWIAAAFAIGAGFFWLFTICCCSPDHSRRGRRSRGGAEGEKLMHGPYQPIGDQHNNGGYPQQYSQHAPQSYGAPQRDLAYEPYSHSRA